MPEPSESVVSETALDASPDVQHVDAEPTTSTTEAFDWTPYGEQSVTVKVKGEELQVPLKEALAGYQRQADYTRDNQALAARAQEVEFAEALTAALARNPEATISYLQNEYGLTEAQAEAVAEGHELDPWQQRVDSFISQQEQQLRDTAVQRELEAVKGQFSDIDESALLRTAIEHQVDLSTAALVLAGQQMRAETEARAAHEAQQAAAEQAATEAKRATAGLIAGGHSTAAGATVPGASGKPSLREAFAGAVRQHG